MENLITQKIRSFAGAFEKFVEHNIIEKDQRDDNLRKLAGAFESFLKESPLKNASFVNRKSEAKVSMQVKKWPHFKGELPKYQTSGSSGLDVRAQLNETMVIPPGARALVPTGMSLAVPEGFEIQARPRSGLAIREGLSLVNTPGTIDSDFRGEVKIILINLGDKDIEIKDQDRIAQLCVCPIIQAQVVEVDDLDSTDRGAGGFGSTGRA